MTEVFGNRYLRVILPVLLIIALLMSGVQLGTNSAGKIVLTIGTVEAAGNADYTATGTNDHTPFGIALNALPSGGGELKALAGSYSFGGTVTRAINNVTISGVGIASSFAYNGSSPVFTAGGNNWTFRDLKVDAGGINMGATTGWVWINVWVGTTHYPYLTASNVDFGSVEIRAQTFESDVTTGTAPLTVASTTTVTNLSADLVDGYQGTRSATIIVAAYDATATEKAQADYVCGATDADTVIEGALAAAAASGHGKVILLGDVSTGSGDIDAISEVDFDGNGCEIIIATDDITNGITFNSTTNTKWSNFTIRRTGTSVGASFNAILFVGTTDYTTVVENVIAYNDGTSAGVGGGAFGAADTAHPTVRNCEGYSAINSHSSAWYIAGSLGADGSLEMAYPRIIGGYYLSRGTTYDNNGIDCEGTDGTAEGIAKYATYLENVRATGSQSVGGGQQTSHGIAVKWGSNVHIKGGVYTSGKSSNSAAIQLEQGCNAVVEDATAIAIGGEAAAYVYGVRAIDGSTGILKNVTSLIDPYYRAATLSMDENSTVTVQGGYYGWLPHNKAWSYDDADNGRFRPFATDPYQLVNLTVYINVANPGVTLDIGTSIGGSQVVAGVGINVIQMLSPAIVQVQVAANGYLYATPSAPITDGDVQIYYSVVKNITDSYGLQIAGTFTGWYSINNAVFKGPTATYVCAPESATGEVNHCTFEWLTLRAYPDASANDWSMIHNSVFRNLNLTAGWPTLDTERSNIFLGYLSPGQRAIGKVALAPGNTNAITVAYHNPYANDVYVERIEGWAGGGNAGSHVDMGVADDATGTNRGTEFFNDLPWDSTALYSSYVAAGGGTQTMIVALQDSASATDGWIVGQILDGHAPGGDGDFYIYLIGGF